jgi:hypothetical protein
MAVPNANQITATLRMMGDAQLQQYAAMHKNDPYIFPLAFEESNMRKQQRAAQQAQGQPQNKVVDQDLMAMAPQPPMPPQGMPPQGGPQMAQQQLPEQQGIGALPVPNMQHMADGGIAGYAEGGNEFNYAGADDGPLVHMAGGGIAHFADGGLAKKYELESMEMGSGNRIQYSPDVAAYAKQLSMAGQAEQTAYADKERARMLEGPTGMPFTKKDKPIPFDPGRGDSWDNEPNIPFDAGRGNSYDNEPAGKEPAKKKSGVSSGASGGGKKLAANVIPPEAPAKTAGPAEKVPTGEDLIAQALKGSKTLNDEAAIAYKPYHDQLNKENEEIAGRKADNRAYALLAAGLGMMGGTSSNAAVNIAAGGIKGLATYQEAEKADAAARKANQQSQMLLMQAERAERSGNMKVAGDMQSRAEQARQFGITAEQHAETLKETKAYHQGMLANDAIKAKAAMLSAQNRGTGMYGPEDKHMAALAKVESVLNSNPVYKEAAKNASMPGNIGAAARATVTRLQQETYSRFAPELLQSGQGSPSGSGGGVDMSQWGKPQVIKP